MPPKISIYILTIAMGIITITTALLSAWCAYGAVDSLAFAVHEATSPDTWPYHDAPDNIQYAMLAFLIYGFLAYVLFWASIDAAIKFGEGWSKCRE